MHWKLKARLQYAAALLPTGLGNALYYRAQRQFGGLRTAEPTSRLRAAMEIVSRLENRGRSVSERSVVEIGTGHQINLPIALWLCGAARVVTVDLNRYLRHELVRNDIAYVCGHTDEILHMFGEHGRTREFRRRLDRLSEWDGMRLDQILSTMNIQYLAPCNAARLPLADKSVDYHISYTVLEHVLPDDLIRLFREGSRILNEDGLFVHCIDFSDHFSHSDSSISSINFLQFSEAEWSRIAGNRFMYHNRFRVDEFEAMLRMSNVDVHSLEPVVDSHARSLLDRNELPLDGRFRRKSTAVNATSHAWVVGSSIV